MRATNPGFVPDSPFTRPLPEAWTDFFSRFPKAELHCHLLGTITKSTFEDLVRLSGAPVTQEEIDGFFTRGDKPVGVLRIFRALEAHILSRPEFLERIAYEHTVAVSRLGVRYIEYFWNSTGLKHFYSFDEGQKAIIRGLKRAEAECGTVGRLIPSIDREDTPEEAVFMVEEMIRHPMPETLGIGIDYRETGHEPENFWKAYRLAKKAGLHITAHAGEFGEHWRNVETAMDLLEVERVDHGYTITDNPALMEEARRQLNPAAAVARYERVLELYAGRLLPMFCNEPWVETRSLTLHVQYRIALFQVLEACKRKGENERIVKLCRRAIELDPYEERLYLEMIQALETLGRHEQALEMTRRGNAMGCLHHAVEPERVGVVSRQARQADRNLENDISRLAEELSADDTPGAAYCSFENFRQIYHLQRGVQSRFGVPVYLALLTMSPAQNADPAETGSMMEQLGELIHKSLRQCDAMARYSENQYVLLISGNSSAENGSTPLERIKAAFYRVPAHGRYLLNYHMYAPELHALSADARRR